MMPALQYSRLQTIVTNSTVVPLTGGHHVWLALRRANTSSFYFFIVSTFQPRWSSQPTVGVYHVLGPLRNRKTVEADFSFSSPKFYRGAKTPNFSPKFRPHSSSDRCSFDLRHSIGNLKQTCQGPMVDVPPHQIWCRSVPPTLRSDGANGTPKVHKLKISHLLAVPAALGKQSAAGCAPAVVPPATLKNCS